MSRPKTNALIEFKGTTLPVVSVTLHSLEPEVLARSAAELFGGDAFFDGDAAVLELEGLAVPPSAPIDWLAVRRTFAGHGLHVIGIHAENPALRESAARAGLPQLAPYTRPRRAAEAEAPVKAAPPPPPPPAPPPAPAAVVPPPPPPAPPTHPVRILDKPLRSGQQVYARGGDLVVLAAVNPGAEVIADGSIHVYAPLRGRALAGASGQTDARIFTTRFEAELVSIAGIYRTFASGVPDGLGGRPVHVQLAPDADGKRNRLTLAALSTD